MWWVNVPKAAGPGPASVSTHGGAQSVSLADLPAAESSTRLVKLTFKPGFPLRVAMAWRALRPLGCVRRDRSRERSAAIDVRSLPARRFQRCANHRLSRRADPSLLAEAADAQAQAPPVRPISLAGAHEDLLYQNSKKALVSRRGQMPLGDAAHDIPGAIIGSVG